LIRIDAPPKGAIRLRIANGTDSVIETSLDELRAGRLTRAIQHEGESVLVSLVLCHDGTDPNIDFPLPAAGVFTRDVPLFPEPEGIRVISAAALLESGRIVYSPAVVVESTAGKEPTRLPWIETHGAADDFTPSGSSKTANPFTPSDVRQASLPRNRIPYFHLGFEEGTGSRLNDVGIEHQSGRAWVGIQPRGVDRARYATSGFEWLPSGGLRGEALRLSASTSIQFRSKSAPLGPRTLSFWVRLAPTSGQSSSWRALRADPFDLEILPQSQVRLRFELASTKAESLGKAPLHEGWNHLVFCYDLNSISMWHDGNLITSHPGLLPSYQRTHVTNDIAFRTPQRDGLGFTGEIDEVEVIGTALDPGQIEKLFEGTPWIAH
jgi:hypothetical protein